MADESAKKIFTFEEVKNHNKAGGCWLVIHDNVYDVTKFLDEVFIIAQRSRSFMMHQVTMQYFRVSPLNNTLSSLY